MDAGWRYRISSFIGAALLTVAAVVGTNLRVVHETFAQVPFFGNPAPEVLPASELRFAVVTTLVVVLATMWPLFKPRPRRILDTILSTQKRVFMAMVGLAAIGYFKYSYRLPRTTLMLTTAVLFIVLPLFMTTVRRRPQSSSRAVIVGDDPEAMESLLSASTLPVIGYVSPPSAYAPDGIEPELVSVTDGGTSAERLDELPCLGGLARLDEVLVEQDVDTVLLAFAATDREEFFGTLETCYEHGVAALVHQDHADHVLTVEDTGASLLSVDLEPWDWQTHVAKRLFDIAFAGTALFVLSPVILLISVAIKLDDGGPILYSHERTAAFGDTFTVSKFRSMIPDAESESGAKLSEEDKGGVDPRVTRVGRVLRKTHLDEIPQLWSILVGDMSVVGPRPERPQLDTDIEQGVGNWRRRWFVRPGLTGLAQINDATGAEPEEKLRFDLLYIRKQSFWFDLKIVIRQLWMVGTDAVNVVLGSESVKGTKQNESQRSTDIGSSPEPNEQAVESTETESDHEKSPIQD
ncbi:Sugar transferase involved in LPS biosynthesis (colanic, teichoic acid) [Halovenus aranensis]|uniref:Sugar transferase involved in LPS biosynthesis (Colanic, teichoic acid) n=1 Tax=Halovenus aranensis TaxID=890420 RepID=A0A1G8VW49_9EURY|nr:sugar transferase [Halovenus aranensis]SDJ70027.1 Sugar transferase involved in LPS biosynthesis (colanic, teichoic acid) [Halovenus aranensis]